MAHCGQILSACRHPEEIKNEFPEEFKTENWQMLWKEYVLLGKKKGESQIQQVLTIRMTKDGLEGGTGGYDLSQTWSDLEMYEVHQTRIFMKLSPERKQQLLDIDKATYKTKV